MRHVENTDIGTTTYGNLMTFKHHVIYWVSQKSGLCVYVREFYKNNDDDKSSVSYKRKWTRKFEKTDSTVDKFVITAKVIKF